MARYTSIVILNIIFCSVVLAEVPVLNSTTVKLAKSQVLNKCINADGHIIYTQFECAKTSIKVDDTWIENANLTFVMPEKYIVFQEGNSLTMLAKEDQNKDKTLEEMVEGRNFFELFNMGIQAYIQRTALLNSL